MPLSIEVFPGNTKDPATFSAQVRKVVERFGGGEVTFVGDRGMIKSGQIEDLKKVDFHYITAITKPQIEKLLKTGVIQMALFDQDLVSRQAISWTNGERQATVCHAQASSLCDSHSRRTEDPGNPGQLAHRSLPTGSTCPTDLTRCRKDDQHGDRQGGRSVTWDGGPMALAIHP